MALLCERQTELLERGPRVDCLLGRDVLDTTLFLYLGPEQQFVLAFQE